MEMYLFSVVVAADRFETLIDFFVGVQPLLRGWRLENYVPVPSLWFENLL